MAKTRYGKTVVVETTWKCTSCDNVNPGLHKDCGSCGNPREVKELHNSSSPVDSDGRIIGRVVTDTAELKIFGAGEDWHCRFCDAGNINRTDEGRTTNCFKCGAVRSEKDVDTVAGRGSEHFVEQPVESTYVETDIPYVKIDHSYQRPQTDTYSQTAYSSPKNYTYLYMGIGVVVVAILAFLLVWGLKEHKGTGTVVSISWESFVQQHDWERTSDSDWERNISNRSHVNPSNGRNTGEYNGEEIGSCHQKEDLSDDYKCNPHEICTDVTSCSWKSTGQHDCKDNGNGSQTCREIEKEVCVVTGKKCDTQYDTCYREHDYCDYYTWKWVSGQSYRNTGSDYVVIDPVVTNTRLQYTDNPVHTYNVNISYVDDGKQDSWTLHPQNISDYHRWKIGQKMPVVINNFGMVKLDTTVK